MKKWYLYIIIVLIVAAVVFLVVRINKNKNKSVQNISSPEVNKTTEKKPELLSNQEVAFFFQDGNDLYSIPIDEGKIQKYQGEIWQDFISDTRLKYIDHLSPLNKQDNFLIQGEEESGTRANLLLDLGKKKITVLDNHFFSLDFLNAGDKIIYDYWNTQDNSSILATSPPGSGNYNIIKNLTTSLSRITTLDSNKFLALERPLAPEAEQTNLVVASSENGDIVKTIDKEIISFSLSKSRNLLAAIAALENGRQSLLILDKNLQEGFSKELITNISCIQWSPDDKILYFCEQKNEGNNQKFDLFKLEVANKKIETLFSSTNDSSYSFEQLSVNPAGNILYFLSDDKIYKFQI